MECSLDVAEGAELLAKLQRNFVEVRGLFGRESGAGWTGALEFGELCEQALDTTGVLAGNVPPFEFRS